MLPKLRGSGRFPATFQIWAFLFRMGLACLMCFKSSVVRLLIFGAEPVGRGFVLGKSSVVLFLLA